MHRRLTTAALVAALFATAGPPLAKGQEPTNPTAEAAGFTEAGLKEVRALIGRAVDEKKVAGAVWLLARRGRPAIAEAVGKRDIEADLPMRPDTIFRIASMTKPITSLAAMMLVEEGKLDLDDPLAKYLPEFREARVLKVGPDGAATTEPARRPITIRHVITQTSGIVYGFLAPTAMAEAVAEAGITDGLAPTDLTLAENVRRIARLPLAHQPGASWTYGLNTDVLGRVIEVASGTDLDTFFRARIFGPLKMADTHFYPPAEKRDRLAALYGPGPEGTLTRVADEPIRAGNVVYSAGTPYGPSRSYYSGGAGLVSTAPDYASFLRMFLEGGRLDGVRLISGANARAMGSNQIGDLVMPFDIHGERFGLGFGVFQGPNTFGAGVGTYSWAGIYYTFFFVDPSTETLGILMTQRFPFEDLAFNGEFLGKAAAAADPAVPTGRRGGRRD